jgi:hypothetical protein
MNALQQTYSSMEIGQNFCAMKNKIVTGSFPSPGKDSATSMQ